MSKGTLLLLLVLILAFAASALAYVPALRRCGFSDGA
jgi:hypothetical protein